MDSPQLTRGHGWLRMISFASAVSSQGKLAARLEADLLGGQRPPKDLRLLARRGGKITAHRPDQSSTERIAGPRFIRRRQVLRWAVSFELPVLVAEDPRTTFQLIAEPHPLVDLPDLGWEVKPPIYERRTPRAGALLAASAALLAGLAPGFALADGGSSAPAPAASSAAASTPVVSGPTQAGPTTAPETTTVGAPTTTGSAPVTQTTPTQTTTSAPVTTTTTITTTSTTPTTSTTSTTTTTISTKPSHLGGGKTLESVSGSHHRGHRSRSHGSKTRSHHAAARHHVSHHTGGAALKPRHAHPQKPAPVKPPAVTAPVTPVVSSGSPWTIPVMADPFTSAQLRTYAALVGGLAQPPKFLVKIYQAAAHHYRIPWQVLAAINYVETHYGKDLAVSPAGAIGWMQFMPATWAEYGESVNLKGKPAGGMPDPWDPTDAIFAAAKYLTAAGARRNLPGAVYAYNHAGWYVQEVLSIAEEITRHGLRAGSKASHKIWAMTAMAHLLNGLPYVWGGGHSSFSLVSTGYDCSGFVSAVLHAAGYLPGPQTTQTLPDELAIKPGPGRWVTILDRTDAGIGDDHVIIDIDGQWWESGGWGVESDRVHRMHNVTPAYLQSFNLVLHPKGL